MKKVLLEMPVGMDLSEIALHNAHELFSEWCIGHHTYPVYSHYVLRVASQNMGHAVFLQNSASATLEISPVFAPDEWSLTMNWYDKGMNTVTVHSKGA